MEETQKNIGDMDEKNTEKNLHEKLSPVELEDIAINKDTAAASYTLLFAPVLLITRRDSKFIQFHATQGLVLGAFFILLWFLGGYISLFRYATVLIVFACVVGFLHALQGHKYPIPFISEIVSEGLSPASLFRGIKRAFSFIGKIFLGLFPKKISETVEQKMIPSPVKKLQERILFLEEFFVLEKYFSAGEKISALSELQKKFLENFLKKFKGEVSREDKKYIITGKEGKIFIGNFSSSSFLVAGNFEILSKIFGKKISSTNIFQFGEIEGRKFSFSDESKTL